MESGIVFRWRRAFCAVIFTMGRRRDRLAMKNSGLALVAVFCAVFTASGFLSAQTAATGQQSAIRQPDALLGGFLDPPNGARPRVWWHWMNGNISEEGIKLDLEWMHRVGLGGVTIFEGAINTPQVVPQRLIYMTPEWKQAFNVAVAKARGFDMEVAIASSPGWSETGGPWVPAAQGMKKMVWSATRIEGERPFKGALAHPPEESGSFQNLSIAGRRSSDDKVAPLPRFYADVAVIAYKIPDGDKPQTELKPRITSSSGAVNAVALSDGDIATAALTLAASAAGSESWIEFDYGRPQSIQAVMRSVSSITRATPFRRGLRPVTTARIFARSLTCLFRVWFSVRRLLKPLRRATSDCFFPRSRPALPTTSTRSRS
jgi:hypothetical protein